MLPSLAQLAAALDGQIHNGRVLCPGPGHSRKDRSLSVRPSTGTADGFVVHSFSGDDWRDCKAYVRERLGLPAFGKRGRS